MSDRTQHIIDRLEKIGTPETLALASDLRKTIQGPRCTECGGPIHRPRRGMMPTVCGPTCRKRRNRRRAAQALVADIDQTAANLQRLGGEIQENG